VRPSDTGPSDKSRRNERVAVHTRIRLDRQARRGFRRAAAALIVVVMSASVVALCAVGTASANPPTYTWPEFHDSPALSGVSADPTISSSNASTLGVKWMSPLGPSLDSPVVAYNSRLKLTVAYTGGAGGYFEAVNVANGEIIWSDYLGAAMASSPIVNDGNVWVAPQSTGRLYKLNAATGAIGCSAAVTNGVLSTPVIATPPGGVTTVFLGSLGAGEKNGPVTAYAETNCAQLWQWSSYIISGQMTGTWAPLSYGVDASGVGLVIVGSANPDSTVYALNAATGALVWHYSTYCPASEDWDVGAGTDISAPGRERLPRRHGVRGGQGRHLLRPRPHDRGARVELQLRRQLTHQPHRYRHRRLVDARSERHLVGLRRQHQGLYALNAVTGAELWFLAGTGDIESSPDHRRSGRLPGRRVR
jgi:hypothetical protein